MRAVALLVLLSAGLAHAQTEAVVSVPVSRGTISGLVMHREGARDFKSGVALFPGHPGIMKLKVENGEPQFGMRGNFLVRSRRHWLDDATLVVVVDAPSDEWTSFTQHFRSTPPYGASVKALVEEIGRRYRVEDWTFVGTSEGSISAFHAARMNPGLARRVILTSSVFKPGKNGPGLTGADWRALNSQLLCVHHADDPCQFTAYRDAVRHAELTASPLLTVRGGGPGKGGPCEAFSAHGYVGVEREVVRAMHAWVRSGEIRSELAFPAL